MPLRHPPIHHPPRRGFVLRWVGLLWLGMVSKSAFSLDLLVVTDGIHLIPGTPQVRVIELELPARIEAELASGLPADPVQAAAIVRQRLRDGGPELQRRLARSYAGVAEAWSLGVTKLPAVVIDHRYVVYGDPDVTSVVVRIESFRRSRP